MCDVDLLRCLGLRYSAVLADRARQQQTLGTPRRSRAAAPTEVVAEGLEQHFWIRAPRDDPDELVSKVLRTRGVAVLTLDGWGPPFEKLMQRCFPSERPRRAHPPTRRPRDP